MKLNNKTAVLNTMQQIELIQHHMKALDDVIAYLSRDHYAGNRDKLDTGNLRERLYNDEVRRWRDLCMWGLTLDDAERDRIKAAAHDRVIQGKHVADWLTPDGRSPGSWLQSDESEFRRMARDAFLSAARDQT